MHGVLAFISVCCWVQSSAFCASFSLNSAPLEEPYGHAQHFVFLWAELGLTMNCCLFCRLCLGLSWHSDPQRHQRGNVRKQLLSSSSAASRCAVNKCGLMRGLTWLLLCSYFTFWKAVLPALQVQAALLCCLPQSSQLSELRQPAVEAAVCSGSLTGSFCLPVS